MKRLFLRALLPSSLVALGLLVASAVPAAVSASGPLGFAPAVNYGIHAGQPSVAVTDLNGDGNPDLVVANSGSADVSVLLGKGDGSFNPAVNYPAHTAPRSVAVGEVNGDGKLDLVVVNSSSDDVSVLLGNGDGSFAAPLNTALPPVPAGFPLEGGPQSVGLGDLNGDGKLDLAITFEPSTVELRSYAVVVLLGSGDGSFGSAVSYPSGTGPRSIALADLNRDGALDLVAVSGVASSTRAVSVLLGNGAGSFGPTAYYSLDGSPVSVQIADLNGDGTLDLAVACAGGGVSVLLGNSDGSFGPAATYAAGTHPTSVGVGDFNADGYPDLAVANFGSNDVSVLLGRGDGSFDAAIGYPVESGPRSLAVSDLNGDGSPDLVVGNESHDVSVLLNTIDTTPPTITASATSNGNLYTGGTWASRDVVVHFACTDTGSGVATVTPDQTVTNEGSGWSVTGSCSDSAGNSASATFANVQIDKTAPVLRVSGATDGTTYVLPSVPARPTFAPVDNVSGIADHNDSWTILTSPTPGAYAYIYSAWAIDAAGNTTSETRTYHAVDRTPPPPPGLDLAAASDSGVSASDKVTRETSLVLTGWAEPSSTVALFRDGTAAGTTTADRPSGTWSITDSNVGDDVHSYTAAATDPAGNTSAASAALAVTVDTIAPALNVTGALSGGGYTLPNLPSRPTFAPNRHRLRDRRAAR
jgi:hypothetical protein